MAKVAKVATVATVPFVATMKDLETPKCLRFDGRSAVVVGLVKGEKAVVSFDEESACSDAKGLVELIPKLSLELTNHSGAEYSYYNATTEDARYSVEVIWPAQQWQIDRKMPSEYDLIDETPELYQEKMEPFIKMRAEKDGWIDKVCSLEKERDRNLFACDDFIINVDTKWQTHAPLSENDADRAQWYGQPWTRDLYLLAIVRHRRLRSLRDLRGSDAMLCVQMRTELQNTALRIYGVPASKLRIFFHYHPQFFRLHAHCVRIEQFNPGSEVERAHLLSSVIQLLQRDSDFYASATLPVKLRKCDKISTLFTSSTDPTGQHQSTTSDPPLPTK